MLENLTQIQARTFLTAAKERAKGSHTVVSNLKNTVEERKKTLVTLLEEKVLGVYAHCISITWMTPTELSFSTKRDCELKDTFIRVVLGAQRYQIETEERRVNRSCASKPTESAIYLGAMSNIASSRELLGHYERASRQVTLSKRAPMRESGWEMGSQTLRRILQKQGEKIKLEVHQLLNEDSRSSKEQGKVGVSKLDTDLWDRFAVGEAKEEHIKVLDGKSATWAEVAMNAQRGVRRAVKDLPDDRK